MTKQPQICPYCGAKNAPFTITFTGERHPAGDVSLATVTCGATKEPVFPEDPPELCGRILGVSVLGFRPAGILV